MLYKNEFDKIWANIIKKIIKEHSQKFGLKYKSLFWTKILLKRLYVKYADSLLKTYMGTDTVNIDRHKIASCVLKAMLIYSPLYIPLSAKVKYLFSNKPIYEIFNQKTDKDTTKKLLTKHYVFFNEYLALSVVISILNSYINSDKRSDRFKHKIVLPEPFPDGDTDYLLDVCIGLHYSNIRQFNPIIFANTLFLWEKYSCRKTQCDNVVEKYKELLIKTGKTEEQAEKLAQQALFGAINNTQD